MYLFALSRFKPMPELDLDTVVEERSEFDAEVNVHELLQAPKDPNRLCVINHPISFRSFRFGYGASGQPLKKPSNPAQQGPTIGSPVPKRSRFIDPESLNSLSSSSSSATNATRNDSSASTISPTGTVSTQMSRSPLAVEFFDSVEVEGEVFSKGSTPSYKNNKELPFESGVEEQSSVRVTENKLSSNKTFNFIIPRVSVVPYDEEETDNNLNSSNLSDNEGVEIINESSRYGSRMCSVKYHVTSRSEDLSPDCARVHEGCTANRNLVNTNNVISTSKGLQDRVSDDADNCSKIDVADKDYALAVNISNSNRLESESLALERDSELLQSSFCKTLGSQYEIEVESENLQGESEPSKSELETSKSVSVTFRHTLGRAERSSKSDVQASVSEPQISKSKQKIPIFAMSISEPQVAECVIIESKNKAVSKSVCRSHKPTQLDFSLLNYHIKSLNSDLPGTSAEEHEQSKQDESDLEYTTADFISSDTADTNEEFYESDEV